MLLIVAHHFVANSGLLSEGGLIYRDPFSAKSIFLLIFGAWGKTGINCFVLISGYFMCESHITLKKFLKLVLEVYFYKIVIFIMVPGNWTTGLKKCVNMV
jgi:peptidoglycan/LPS O-acetylase OafA/YrhL